ncbi:MAG TPA: response regulator [Kofleriaceae bacterium]|jgi:CheY-like chemotaxis protein
MNALAPFDISGIKILLVDDDEDVLHLVKKILGNAGANVTVRATVQDALASLDDNLPDIIISDLDMPHCDGYELARYLRLRSPAEGGAIPAIALTAHIGSSYRARALASGFTAHLAKPMRALKLIETISDVIGATRHEAVTQLAI